MRCFFSGGVLLTVRFNSLFVYWQNLLLTVLYKTAIHIRMDISSGVTLRNNKTGQVPEEHEASQLSDVFFCNQ